MVKENTTTVTLTGTEVTVEFDKNYTYFWLNNIGDSAVYASMKPDVTADKDGVITVLSGTAAGTMHGYGADKLYLNGSGKVQIIGTYSAFCPFRVGAKGGDSGGTSEFSAAGSATRPVYFDADGRPAAISHTIEADVPANAVFTDTKYNDTAVKAHIVDTNVHITADERTKWNAKSDFSGSYSDLSNAPTSLPANGGNADTVNGHTVEIDVPSGAVFTDTVYDDKDISDRVTDLETDLGGHSVKSDVPANAVFTDTTYSLSASYKTITLTDSKGNTSDVEVVRAESLGHVAPGETATIFSSLAPNQAKELKLLAAYDPSNGKHEYVWFDGTLKAIGDSTVSGFTVSSSYGTTTVSYTAPSSGSACQVYVFHFIKYY